MQHLFLVFLWSAISAISFALAMLASPMFSSAI
jgi:hypothetical protein